MKSFLLASAMLVLGASLAFGDGPCNPHPLRPDGRDGCLQIGASVLKASMDDMFARDSAKIDAARKHYFALWPNGPGIDQAEDDFLRAMRQKDSYYLALSTSMAMNLALVKAGNALAILGGDTSLNDLNKVPDNMDGGIRPYAKPLFARWVAAMRRAEDKKASSGSAVVDGAQNLMQFVAKMLNDPSANPGLLIDTLQDDSNWRKAYEDARNWSELMSSGLNLSKFVAPDVYIRSQMEADVTWSLGQNKRDDIPDPVAATLEFYQLFVKMFGEKEVLAAANATLLAPKNSVGGLATRSPVEIGEFVASPSPNPYYLFLSQLTKSSPKAYAIALAFDPNVMLSMQPAAAFSTEENWQKANTVYTQLVAKYGQTNVWNAAGQLKDTPKDSEGKIAGDPQSQPLRAWFQALLKDPKAAVPDGQVAHFRAGSYDPRWVGKPVIVRGTVARVDVDTHGSPQYATIRFQDSRPDGFVAFSPYPDMLQSSYGNNFAGLTGKTIEVQGDVQTFGQNAGVRILNVRQLKVLDPTEASVDFRESKPAWLAAGVPAPATVDVPEYLAWKKFPAGTKAVLETRVLSEVSPGTDQYTRTLISRITLHLDSVDEQRVIVTAASTIFERTGQSRESPPDQLIYPARRSPPGGQDNTSTTTGGEETVVINGKKIATKWESVARANDPMTFTKTWRSDDVPGGLVHQLAHEHTEIGGKPFRTIRETIYAPIDGVMPVLGDATPPVGGRGAPAVPATPQNRSVINAATPPVPNAVPNPASNRAEFQRRYNVAVSRIPRVRVRLTQFQNRQASSGVTVPADVAAAADGLDGDVRATRAAISAGDDSIAERNLNDYRLKAGRIDTTESRGCG
ncbi:MAG TPA: hypothetical protein VGL72_27100 [Bryobacteraceae bacterium]|jgi:hypothetical protein